MENGIFDGLHLLDLALQGRWNEALYWARRFPHELVTTNEDGMTALHFSAIDSLEYHSHIHLLLLRVNQDYIKRACLIQDNSGNTPLSSAAACFASSEKIQAFIDVCPEAVSLRNNFGDTCLHHICAQARGGYSTLRRALARAEMMLEVDPALARACDNTGLTPIHVLCHNYEDNLESYWLSKEPDVQLGILRIDVDGLWLFFDTLLRAAAYVRSGNALHGIVSMPHPPSPLAMFACRRFPEIEKEQDEDGNTPLHLAVQRQSFDIVGFLASRFPDCASILNNNGESALHLATRSFPSFNRSLFLLIRARPHLLAGVLGELDNAALYPFLLRNLLKYDPMDGAPAVFDVQKRNTLFCTM